MVGKPSLSAVGSVLLAGGLVMGMTGCSGGSGSDSVKAA